MPKPSPVVSPLSACCNCGSSVIAGMYAGETGERGENAEVTGEYIADR